MCLTAVLLLSGCQGDNLKVVEPPQNAVTLRFCGFKVGKTKIEEIETILNKYMEQKNVVIVYEGIAENYNDILTKRLQSGYADDLFMINTSMVTTYMNKGWCGTKIVDLSKQTFIEQYSPMVRRLITMEGKIPAVPMNLSVIGMLGNMDVLRACGIHEMPRTYEAWVQAMETVREHGYTPMVNYLGNNSSLSFLMAGRSVAPYVEGDKIADENTTALQVYTKGIADVYNLLDKGLLDRAQLARETEARSYQTVLGEQFAAGGVAFAVAPSWGLHAFLAGKPNFAYQYAGLPVGDKGPLTGVRASVLVAVNNESAHAREAEAFLAYLMQPEHIENYAAEQTSLSPLKGARTENPIFAEPLAQIGAGLIFSDTDFRIPFNLTKLLNNASERMSRGEKLESILKQFAAEVEAALAERKKESSRQ